MSRQRMYKRAADDDDKLKRHRAWANAYELSQDLHEKQLEMLERKYGGHLKAKRAARIIQQAFRQYSMNRNFERLRTMTNEKRLSRHMERSNTIWTDMVVESSYSVGMQLRRTVTGPEKSVSAHSHLGRSYTFEENLNQNQFNGHHTFLQRNPKLLQSHHINHMKHSVHGSRSDYNISSGQKVSMSFLSILYPIVL